MTAGDIWLMMITNEFVDEKSYVYDLSKNVGLTHILEFEKCLYVVGCTTIIGG